MKALDRPLVRPLLIVLLAHVAWTIWATDFGVTPLTGAASSLSGDVNRLARP